MSKRKDENTTSGKKGGRTTIATTAVIGGIAGATVGGIAGAMMVSKSARNKVSDTITTAAEYATSAMDAIDEHKDEIRNAADTFATTSKSIKAEK